MCGQNFEHAGQALWDMKAIITMLRRASSWLRWSVFILSDERVNTLRLTLPRSPPSLTPSTHITCASNAPSSTPMVCILHTPGVACSVASGSLATAFIGSVQGLSSSESPCWDSANQHLNWVFKMQLAWRNNARDSVEVDEASICCTPALCRLQILGSYWACRETLRLL